MVFCADTLGQDRSLSEKECMQLQEFAQHFGNSWTEMEKTQLQKTLDHHLNYLKKFKGELSI